MNLLFRSCRLLAPLALFASSVLRADTLFSSLNGATCRCGYGSVTAGGSLASAFTPTRDFLLTGAAAKLYRSVPGVAAVDFSIYSNEGTVPGTSLLDLGTATVSSEKVYSETTAPLLQLSSGQQYWLVLTQTSGLTFNWEALGSSSTSFAFLSPGSSWTYDAPASLQFSISGSPVAAATAPEPSSLTLLGTALAGVIVSIRRRDAPAGSFLDTENQG